MINKVFDYTGRECAEIVKELKGSQCDTYQLKAASGKFYQLNADGTSHAPNPIGNTPVPNPYLKPAMAYYSPASARPNVEPTETITEAEQPTQAPTIDYEKLLSDTENEKQLLYNEIAEHKAQAAKVIDGNKADYEKEIADLKANIQELAQQLADKAYDCDQWETTFDMIKLGVEPDDALDYVRKYNICKDKEDCNFDDAADENTGT